jgi:predicted ferric reductase
VQKIASSDEGRALLHGRYGRLVMERPARKKQLWIAGGIGITPFLSMARTMAAHPDEYGDYDVILIVCSHGPERAFELPELEHCAAAHPNLHVHFWDTQERGTPTIDAFASEYVDDVRDRAVMISGPEGMIADLTSQLLKSGVTRGQIRSEREIGPPGRWDVASPALRYTRVLATIFFALFVLAVIVSTVSRALFA